MLYARRVKKNPESSIAYADDIEKRKEHASNDELLEADFTGRQKAVIIVFVLGIVAIVWGLVTQGWYMNEISAVFMAMALLSGIVSGMSEKEIATEFVKGLGDFVFSAVVVGLARGILVIRQRWLDYRYGPKRSCDWPCPESPLFSLPAFCMSLTTCFRFWFPALRASRRSPSPSLGLWLSSWG